MKHLIALALGITLASPAMAEEKPITLKQGGGSDKMEGNCGSCHSLDYIQMNSPFLSPAGWDAEVTKMIKVFGPPIEDNGAKVIADYLKKNDGG